MITYDNNEYPSRTFRVMMAHGPQAITIATESLEKKLIDEDGDHLSVEAEDLDEYIYFYVPDDVIDLPAAEICQEHLDSPLELIEEV